MEKQEKTNAMRILDAQGESYEPIFLSEIPKDGADAAAKMGRDPASVFKTLVTVGSDLAHYVFVIPVAETLDLKKAAKAAGVKSVEMLPQKQLFPLTGYVHGGCSPIGMKKPFFTVLDETAQLSEKIFFSAGKIGFQVELSPFVLTEKFGAVFADVAQF